MEERIPEETRALAFPLRRALPPAKERPGVCGTASPPPPQEVLPAGNPALPPPPAATRGQDPPDLYSRKSEYTEKAPSTGPFL